VLEKGVVLSREGGCSGVSSPAAAPTPAPPKRAIIVTISALSHVVRRPWLCCRRAWLRLERGGCSNGFVLTWYHALTWYSS